MSIRVLSAGVAAAIMVGVGGPAAAATCQLMKLVEVPVVMRGLQPMVAAKVNGHETNFMIDTGAFFSVVSKEAAARFEMRKSVAPFGLEVKGLGGATRSAEAVEAENFGFAGAGFKNIQFLAGGRIGADDVAGVIGQNIMGPFDVEYDFANGVIRFFKAKDCGDANLAYWAKDMALSRLSLEDQGKYMQEAIARAKVNGRSIRVKFDSGSSVSYLSRRAAARAGIEISSEGVTAGGISYGAYGGGLETFEAPFASFKIGDEEIKNTRLRIADIELGEHGDMLLGADFFLSHRILISSTQKKLYFTYNGGPVFRLQGRPAATTTAQAAPAAPGASAASGKPEAASGPSATGPELARRAAASAARRDFPTAVAEYGQAIELEPDNAAYYRARAMARLANHQPVLAMADLDQALTRQPKDSQALLVRGRLYLQAHEVKKAQADFDAALKLAPADSELSAEVGVSYARAGEYDLALRHLDAWISGHPKSENLAQGLAARCWARALSGKGLEVALADCDQALRRDRNSVFMSYRGVVLYRMGRVDDALSQFAQALKAQPRLAPALYGRGLAELKKGEKVQGEADLEAASALAPEMAQEFRRNGLSPDAPPAATNAGV